MDDILGSRPGVDLGARSRTFVYSCAAGELEEGPSASACDPR